jgi:hypothetical protein
VRCEQCRISNALGTLRRISETGFEDFAFLCYDCRKETERRGDPETFSWLPAAQ